MVYIFRDDGTPLVGPTMDYHSRIAIASYLLGLGAAETAALYHRLVFRRLGYLDRFATECTLLLEHWAHFSLDAAPLLRAWRESGCFMYSVNHPKARPLLDLARVACTRMAIEPEAPHITAADVPDTLEVFPTHPVFPDIAAAAGVAPEAIFRTARNGEGEFKALTPEEFARWSFEVFATVPRAVLLRVEGVREALVTLAPR